MRIDGKRGNLSTLDNLRSVCERFQLTPTDASLLIERLINTIKVEWDSVCDQAQFPEAERQRLWQSAVFNPFCFENWAETK